MRTVHTRSNEKLHEAKVQLAFAEHTRLSSEIRDLERAAADQKQLLAALRMCRTHIESELRRRGFERIDGTWVERRIAG